MRSLSPVLSIVIALFGLVAIAPAFAQNTGGPLSDFNIPGLRGYAPPIPESPLAESELGEIVLEAQLTKDSPPLRNGMVWRIFKPETGPDGKLPMIATAKGGDGIFRLPPGSYLVHAAYGRAGATKRITVSKDKKMDSLILDAGGLKLDAILPGGLKIPSQKLRFSIYERSGDADNDRALIIPNVAPGRIVRLNAGTYHVVSTYGHVNAVIRSDIRVVAGKLTEATVEHRAAQVTLKLVRDKGGEAIADTAWSVETDSGDVVRESVGAFSSMVLAEGNYTVIAKNRDKVYTRALEVVAGRNQDVEVLTTETPPANTEDTAKFD
jgi:hypothetical protein